MCAAGFDDAYSHVFAEPDDLAGSTPSLAAKHEDQVSVFTCSAAAHQLCRLTPAGLQSWPEKVDLLLTGFEAQPFKADAEVSAAASSSQ